MNHVEIEGGREQFIFIFIFVFVLVLVFVCLLESITLHDPCIGDECDVKKIMMEGEKEGGRREKRGRKKGEKR